MADPRPLDFLCIGAPKAGTTSLFHYLRAQKGICLPAIKEAPFFCDDVRFFGGWTAFWNENFAETSPGELAGKVTPQYMGDDRVARRIAKEMPDVKIFCLLRNPIERAFSDFRMRRRAGKEDRNFDVVIDMQLQPGALEQARKYRYGDDPTIAYIARSEYGRLLADFHELFGRERVLVLFSEQLRSSSVPVMERVLEHIGSDHPLVDHGLRKEHHVGGDGVRFEHLPARLRAVPPLRALWHLLPGELRKRIYTKYRFEWRVKSAQREEIKPETRRRLAEYFREDVRKLRQTWGLEVPWRDFDEYDRDSPSARAVASEPVAKNSDRSVGPPWT